MVTFFAELIHLFSDNRFYLTRDVFAPGLFTPKWPDIGLQKELFINRDTGNSTNARWMPKIPSLLLNWICRGICFPKNRNYLKIPIVLTVLVRKKNGRSSFNVPSPRFALFTNERTHSVIRTWDSLLSTLLMQRLRIFFFVVPLGQLYKMYDPSIF